jgi:hypothetical protein
VLGKSQNPPSPHRLKLITKIAYLLKPFINVEKANLSRHRESLSARPQAKVNQTNSEQARFLEASGWGSGY